MTNIVTSDIASLELKLIDYSPSNTNLILTNKSNGKFVYLPEDNYYMYKGPFVSNQTFEKLIDLWLFIDGYSLPDSTSFEIVSDENGMYWLRFIRPMHLRDNFKTKNVSIDDKEYKVPIKVNYTNDIKLLSKVILTFMVYYIFGFYPLIANDADDHLYLVDLYEIPSNWEFTKIFEKFKPVYEENKEVIKNLAFGLKPRVDAFVQAGYPQIKERFKQIKW